MHTSSVKFYVIVLFIEIWQVNLSLNNILIFPCAAHDVKVLETIFLPLFTSI